MKVTTSAAALALLAACTAGWNSVVRYSSRPAPAGLSPVTSVYGTILRSYTSPSHPTLVVEPLDSGRSHLDGVEVPAEIPSHWADTLKIEVRAALLDPTLWRPAALEEVSLAAQVVGVRLLPPDRADGAPSTKARPVGHLKLSQPGFNQDSTIAAVRVTFRCGRLCGSGETILLARKPGSDWRIWYFDVLWVS